MNKNAVVEKILINSKEIINNIEETHVAQYDFINKEFLKNTPITKNYIFQTVFSSFYGLNNAKLSTDFKKAYFSLFDEYRNKREIDKYFSEVIQKLITANEKNNLHFSFSTKLFHTIDYQYPIYDTMIAKLFEFNPSYQQKNQEKKLENYLNFYSQLKDTYDEIIKDKVFDKVIHEFKLKFDEKKYDIPSIKILDFIFWTEGKNLTS